MKPALRYRNSIPFFYDKSEVEFSKDSYEKYDPSVIRQSMLHLADELWGGYPIQEVLDFINEHVTFADEMKVLELGCSVGRMIASISMKHPSCTCWGMDYSYQLLKKAKETWVDGDSTELNLGRYGFKNFQKIKGETLSNLNFGLSKAEALPFEDNTQDLVFSSYLFDRLSDPIQGLQEMKRVLAPSGKMILVTPLNFINASYWEKFHPPIKLFSLLQEMGWKLLEWKEAMIINEPLDARGNAVTWNCVGVVCGF